MARGAEVTRLGTVSHSAEIFRRGSNLKRQLLRRRGSALHASRGCPARSQLSNTFLHLCYELIYMLNLTSSDIGSPEL